METKPQDNKTRNIKTKRVFIFVIVLICAIIGFSIAKANYAHISGAITNFINDAILASKTTFSNNKTFRGKINAYENNQNDEVTVYTADVKIEQCAFDTLQKPKRESVIINEIAWMGNKENSQNEWIELKNNSEKTVNISNWQIIDKDEQIKITIKNKTEIAQNGFFVLARNNEKNITSNETYSGSLKNGDEGIRLFDNNCVLEDEAIFTKWPAGNNTTKQTMERNKNDTSWHTSTMGGGTPNKENSIGVAVKKQITASLYQVINERAENKSTTTLSTQTNQNDIETKGTPIKENAEESKILISEVCVGTENGANDEFLEIYNPTDYDINLSGFAIKKKSSTGNETTLVSKERLKDKIIKSKKYFLIANEGGYKWSEAADLFWPKSYTLANSKNGIVIYNPENEKIDEVYWEIIEKGTSFIRNSWNENQFHSSIPTPQNSF